MARSEGKIKIFSSIKLIYTYFLILYLFVYIIQIIPILAIPSSSTSIIDIAVATELAKSKYQNKFDCMYISSRSVGVMKSISNNGVLGLMKSNSNSIVALETAKYIVNVTKQQKIDFIGSLNILAASHHLEQIPGKSYFFHMYLVLI